MIAQRYIIKDDGNEPLKEGAFVFDFELVNIIGFVSKYYKDTKNMEILLFDPMDISKFEKDILFHEEKISEEMLVDNLVRCMRASPEIEALWINLIRDEYYAYDDNKYHDSGEYDDENY